MKTTERFQQRLLEMCGTSDVNKVAKILGVSYQGARNYLLGRIPDAGVLCNIAENSDISIHWLLTGEGEKYVSQKVSPQADELSALLGETVDTELLIKILSVVKDHKLSSNMDNVKLTSAKKERTRLVIPASKIRNEKVRSNSRVIKSKESR